MPSLSDVPSRLDVDLSTADGIGTSLPLVVANMTAVAGRRMAETIARRGGIAVLPQDVPTEVLQQVVDYVKSRHAVYETPITLGPHQTIAEALALIHKRAHGAVVVVDDRDAPLGIFTEADAGGFDRFTQLQRVMSTDVLCIEDGASPEDVFDRLASARFTLRRSCARAAPRRDDPQGRAAGHPLPPAVDRDGRLMVAAAIGINGDPGKRAAAALAAGVDVIVIDTAHGHQGKTLAAIRGARELNPDVPIVAGNVVTAGAVGDLVTAGADIVKVGVGPGAMCTTRMMTGVGRPSSPPCSSAPPRPASSATRVGRRRRAPPRDVALALAAGASSVMLGSWLAGTYESAADPMRDADGRLYKESFGMASHRAVTHRSRNEPSFERARKELFEEGISSSRMYLDAEHPGVEDIIDQIVAGVRSACTYAGPAPSPSSTSAVVGVQTQAGYLEGLPVGTSW